MNVRGSILLNPPLCAKLTFHRRLAFQRTMAVHGSKQAFHRSRLGLCGGKEAPHGDSRVIHKRHARWARDCAARSRDISLREVPRAKQARECASEPRISISNQMLMGRASTDEARTEAGPRIQSDGAFLCRGSTQLEPNGLKLCERQMGRFDGKLELGGSAGLYPAGLGL